MKSVERVHRKPQRLFAVEETNPGDAGCSGLQNANSRFRRDAAERDERKGPDGEGHQSQLAQAEGLPEGAL